MDEAGEVDVADLLDDGTTGFASQIRVETRDFVALPLLDEWIEDGQTILAEVPQIYMPGVEQFEQLGDEFERTMEGDAVFHDVQLILL